MATGLGLIVVLALLFSELFKKWKLPGLLGMLILGILIGPYCLDFVSDDLLAVSGELRNIALIVILLRAGLGLRVETLRKIGRPAALMSFLPGLLEGGAIIALTIFIFDLPFAEAGMLAFILAAVSPAVVVPSMLNFLKNKVGTNKNIPSLILASASVDDVVAITIFTVFLGIYKDNDSSIVLQLLSIPLSIILGVILGIIIGGGLSLLYKKYHFRDTKKMLIMLGFAILLISFQELVSGYVAIAGLLGVMAIGLTMVELNSKVAEKISDKLSKVWVFAEMLLFVLVGTAVNITVAADSGLQGLLIIGVGLVFRSLGVFLSLIKTNLSYKERIFCFLSYTPKATVQAAMGAVPLAAGVASGDLILAVAVLSILVTAPIGAIAIKIGGKHLLITE